jgi:hypothetical protein
MATLIREYLYDANNRIDLGNLAKLHNALAGKKCSIVMKNGKVCGRYIRFHSGRIGCCHHEDYSEGLKFLNTVCESDESPTAK